PADRTTLYSNDTSTTHNFTLSLHDALPIFGIYFDVDVEEIGKAIETYVPSNMRSQIIEQNGNKIILDAYNANPTSMAAALESFEDRKSTRLNSSHVSISYAVFCLKKKNRKL